jgi:hypothetical protein
MSDILTLRPTGAGASTQWTPDAPTNWSRVDEEVSDGDSSWVLSGTPGNLDLYDLPGSIPATAINLSVTVTARARSLINDPCTMYLVVRTGGVNYYSTSQTIPSDSYLDLSYNWPTNPAGGDWTEAQVNALEIGIETIATNFGIVCTQVNAPVVYTIPSVTPESTGWTPTPPFIMFHRRHFGHPRYRRQFAYAGAAVVVVTPDSPISESVILGEGAVLPRPHRLLESGGGRVLD